MYLRRKRIALVLTFETDSMKTSTTQTMHKTGVLSIILFFYLVTTSAGKPSDAGFSFPENTVEIKFRFSIYKNLIVLPVTINDSIRVNLILDTGCRNLLLFGKRFERLFKTLPDHKVRFSGLGEKPPLTGKLALNNKVSIHSLLGQEIPVIIVQGKSLFGERTEIDGIVGYDIFIKFEIEFDASRQLIKFRPAESAEIAPGFTRIPLRVEDSRPLIQSTIFFSAPDATDCDIMLDTGSALGLLLKSRDEKYFSELPKQILGKGLGGNVTGTVRAASSLSLETFEIHISSVGIWWSEHHSHGSVGMDIMKDYSVVLNYCKGYAGFKKTQKTRKPMV